MTITETRPATFDEAVEHFADPSSSHRYVLAKRWPLGVTCPRCGSRAVYFDASRNGWECKRRHAKRKFTVKTGTVFESSPLGFNKWLPAIWLVANHTPDGSRRLARAIGVTQKTAWFMLLRIRIAIEVANTPPR